MPDTDTQTRPSASAADIRVGASSGSQSSGATGASGERPGLFADAKSQVSGLTEQAATAARNAANQGKDRAAEALGAVSEFAQDVARTIDDKVGGGYGDYARRSGQAVTDFADRLREKDVDELVEDAKTFVRQSPAIAIGVAAAFGFLMTRLVKAGASGGRA